MFTTFTCPSHSPLTHLSTMAHRTQPSTTPFQLSHYATCILNTFLADKDLAPLSPHFPIAIKDIIARIPSLDWTSMNIALDYSARLVERFDPATTVESSNLSVGDQALTPSPNGLFFIAALVLAAKFWDDHSAVNLNAAMATLAYIDVKRINRMEAIFFGVVLDWNGYVDTEGRDEEWTKRWDAWLQGGGPTVASKSRARKRSLEGCGRDVDVVSSKRHKVASGNKRKSKQSSVVPGSKRRKLLSISKENGGVKRRMYGDDGDEDDEDDETC